ncbi:MAG: SRPBCC family protein [Candidatus Eisenbacteria bacterium]|nr:SRPBCC family protein [Candidatus Eisenbacteria bacterium]
MKLDKKTGAGGSGEGGRTRVRPPRLALLLLAVAGLVLAAPASRAEGVELTVTNRAGTYEVRGRFETTADLDTVWRVLTDYTSISSFVGSVRRSEVVLRDGEHLRIRQTATVGVFPFQRTARVLLEVAESPPSRIEFHDVLREDFRTYDGSWSLSGDSLRAVVSYSLDASPRASAPGWLGRGMLSRSARDLLTQVRAEIERRAAKAAPRR